ncbi:DUF3316 domain-containing protein [Photobacterium profundum]|uniref:Acyl-CoA synthetase n=1 Tax=Photobacterium profundum 3TCK TaxID=314280 RepID=Q1Z5U5_9GAMM|nr:DUF3316 domain-containing protein [Photobacterium profundum]EAS43787.1 hypothetical protein P3TCK_15814 [Photobacterium profundum 3TCK]PSV64508.1 DUF3316 domain-containing protein [Photobacterium profundum]
MKKVLLAVTGLVLMSTQVMASSAESMDKTYMRSAANYTVQTGTATLLSDVTATRSSAYQQGYDILNSLNGKSSTELRPILNVSSRDLDAKSIMIEDKEVTVKEFAKQPNVIEYQALVNVKYHYRIHDSNN